jgi:hypothetical protein
MCAPLMAFAMYQRAIEHSCYTRGMITQDSTIEDINEALGFIVDSIAHAGSEARKKALLELVDDLLDEKIAMGSK